MLNNTQSWQENKHEHNPPNLWQENNNEPSFSANIAHAGWSQKTMCLSKIRSWEITKKGVRRVRWFLPQAALYFFAGYVWCNMHGCIPQVRTLREGEIVESVASWAALRGRVLAQGYQWRAPTSRGTSLSGLEHRVHWSEPDTTVLVGTQCEKMR